MTVTSNKVSPMYVRFLLAAALLAASPAWAVNKCKGPDGRVVYQDTLCTPESTSREEVRTWGNSGYVGHRPPPPPKPIEPNAKLQGPPQAAPLLAMYQRWIDAERLAMSTSRIALAVPASTLQAMRREIQGMQVAACLEDARKSLEELIHKSAEAVLQFMGKEELTGLLYQHIERGQAIQKFEREIAALRCE